MERMNYINRPKPAYTQEERIKYLEKSLRELRIEKDEIRKEKWEYRHKILKLEEENKKLKEEVDYRHHRCMVAERWWEDEE